MPRTRRTYRLAVAALGAAVASALALLPRGLAQSPPDRATPPGAPLSAETRALVLGAKALQRNSPLGPMDVYVVGFHPMKEDPQQQMEAHHYCHQVNEDFAQCVLFDGNGRDANLTGIEYIVSARLYDTLPADEKDYWHPHNAEILSGQLVAPGIPAPAEKALMRQKMNSYGKTWHLWSSGAAGHAGDALPLGPPMLAWSFNRDGEAAPSLVEQRDRRMGIHTADKRRQREDLRALAEPQHGVDALRGAFENTREIPGVVEAGR